MKHVFKTEYTAKPFLNIKASACRTSFMVPVGGADSRQLAGYINNAMLPTIIFGRGGIKFGNSAFLPPWHERCVLYHF